MREGFKLSFLLGIFVIFPITAAHAYQDGIFDTYSSDGSAYSACAGCHNGADGPSGFTGYQIRLYKNTITGTNQLANTSDTISKNVPVTLVSYLSGTGASAGGFNLFASSGTFTAGSDTRTNVNGNHADPLIKDSNTNPDTQITHTDANGIGVLPGGKADSPDLSGDVNWSFTYNPPNNTGTVTFSMCGNPVNGDELGDSSDGPSDTGNAPVCSVYTVTLFNDAPVTDNESINVTVGDTVDVTYATLLAGDSDPNGDSISITNFSQPSGNATVTDKGTSFTYDPVDKFEALDSTDPVATDTFTYTISDGSKTAIGTVTVNVTGVNDAPVANPDTIAVAIGGTVSTLQDGITTSVLDNDDDVDVEPLTAVLVDNVQFGTLTFPGDGTFEYIHDGTNNLFDSFTYQASDGDATSSTVTVDINIANTNPTALTDISAVLEGGEVNNIDVLANDTDAETPDSLSVVNITNQTNGSAVVQPDNTVTFTHNDSQTTSASFQYQASDGFLLSAVTTVSITVTPVNDPPQLTTIPDQTATENIAFTFDAGTVWDDVDDLNDGTGTTWSFQSGQPAGMIISNVGVIDWTPPQTEIFDQVYGPIVVRAADGGEDGATAATTAFSITVSPPDGDSDNVADYNDLCLTVADSTNADNDNDGTPGSDGGTNDGGDVCDLDDDNDGMPDIFEDNNGFDSFDPSDADLDADGDGISNLDEFNDGTNPVLANETIDATGYFTPFTLPPPNPTDIHPNATVVTADDLGPFRPGRHSITWTASNSANNNLGTTVQTIDIRPIVNFAADQFVTEGSTVTVKASLNGAAAVYPVTVDYLLSGTAGSGDHNAASGSLVFNSPETTTSFSFDVSSDSQSEGDETIVFTMTDATNAVVGTGGTHTVTVVERNVLHDVALRFTQGGVRVSSAYASEGDVTVEAIVTDPNTAQSYSFNWVNTDNSLVPPTTANVASWNFTPVEGVYRIEVSVSDDGLETALLNRVSRIIKVADAAPTLGTDNSDGEGDDDVTEGLGDSDDDGIPDYLDSVDGNAGGENILPSQTVSLENRVFIETEPGLKFKLGTTAVAAGLFGVIVTDSDIESFGSESGTAPVNASDDFEHVGGGYDFEISGMVAGSSVQVVVPLEVAIPRNASYRKYNPATGWGDFVVDDNNTLSSAPGEMGACPQPGSDQYTDGLNYLDSCLQLTIEDGGLNDADGEANGIIKDPGSISLQLRDPQTPAVKGGGRVHPLLILLLGLGIPLIYLLRKEENH